MIVKNVNLDLVLQKVNDWYKKNHIQIRTIFLQKSKKS